MKIKITTNDRLTGDGQFWVDLEAESWRRLLGQSAADTRFTAEKIDIPLDIKGDTSPTLRSDGIMIL